MANLNKKIDQGGAVVPGVAENGALVVPGGVDHFLLGVMYESGAYARDILGGIDTVSALNGTIEFNLDFLRNGFYPDEHPSTKYVRGLFSRICDDPTIELYIEEGSRQVNAYATANRRIIITGELLKFCKTEEELLFVLHHELRHIECGHFFIPDDIPISFIRKVFRNAGEKRFKESVDADIMSLIDLDVKGVNIAGAYSLLDRFIDELGNECDVTHGSFKERLILLKGAMNARDFDHYDADSQVSIPDDVVSDDVLKRFRGFPVGNGEVVRIKEKFGMRRETIKTMDFQTLYVNYMDLYNLGRKIAEGRAAKTNKMFADYSFEWRSLLEEMEQLMYDKFSEQTGVSLTLDEARCFFHLNRNIRFDRGDLDIDADFIEPNFDVLTSIFDKFSSNTGDVKSLQGLFYYDKGLFMQGYLIDTIVQTFASVLDRFGVEKISAFLNFIGVTSRMADPLQVDKKAPKQVALEMADDVVKALQVNSYKNVFDQDALIRLDKLQTLLITCHNVISERLDGIFGIGNNSGHPVKVDKDNTFRVFDESALEGARHDVRLSLDGDGQTGETTREQLAILGGDPCWNVNQVQAFISDTYFQTHENSHLRTFVVKTPQTLESLMSFIEKIMESSELSNEQKFALCRYHLIKFITVLRFKITPSKDFIGKFVKFFKFLEEFTDIPVAFEIEFGQLCEFLFANVLSKKSFHDGLQMLQEIFDNEVLSSNHKKLILTVFFDVNFSKKTTRFSVDDFECAVELIKWSGCSAGTLLDIITKNVHVILPKNRDDLRKLLSSYKTLTLLSSQTPSDEVFHRFISFKLEWDLNDVEDCVDVLRISDFSSEPTQKISIQCNVWKRLVDFIRKGQFSLSALLELMTKEALVAPSEIFADIVDLAESQEDMQACLEYLKEYRKMSEDVGKFVLIDTELTARFLRDKLEVLLCFLDPDSDLSLKGKILNAYLGYQYLKNIGDDNPCGSEFDTAGGPYCKVPDHQAPAAILRRLYSMNDFQRKALVHVLLIGDNGVLYDKDAIVKLVDYFFDKFTVSDGDSDDEAFMHEARKVIKMMVNQSEPEDLYYLFMNLISPRILASGDMVKGWEKAPCAQDLANEIYSSCGNYAGKFFNRAINGVSSRRGVRGVAMGVVDNLLDDSGNSADAGKLDAMGLLIEIAQSMGSLGVRFLQLLGMYADVPPKYRDAFKKIYSDVEGQFKLTAYDTIVRNLPEEDRKGLKMGKRIGGGSILTVYEFETENGAGVIKVVNPNILVRMERTFEVLSKVVDRLVDEDPDKYTPYKFLLQDVKDWIVADADLAQSAHLQQEFADQNTGAKSESGVYESAVPGIMHSNGKFVIEHKVEGETLQYVGNLEGNVDVPEIVGLIRQQLFGQIMSGLVHSDVHPGNFVVSSDNKVYWLDRTLLLQLTEAEQAILINSALADSDMDKMVAFTEGIFGLPENAGFEDREAVLAEIQALQFTDFKDAAKRVMIILRRNKLHIPLNITLTLKNVLGVENMGEV